MKKMTSVLAILMFLFLAGPVFPQGVYQVKPPTFQTMPSPCQPAQSPQKGSLSVESAPSGAEVYINHIYVGGTPVCVTNLASGTYLVRVSGTSEYLPFAATMSFQEGNAARGAWSTHPLRPSFGLNFSAKGRTLADLHVNLLPKAVTWLRTGLQALNTGQTDEAEQDFLHAATGKPQGLPKAYALLGLMYAKNNEFHQAVSAFRDYLFFHESSAAAFTELGNAYDTLGDYHRALTAYKSAVLSLPDFKDALNNPLAATWKNINKLRAEIKAKPSSWGTRVQLGYLYEEKGKLKDGIAQFKAILRHNQAMLQQEEAVWRTA